MPRQNLGSYVCRLDFVKKVMLDYGDHGVDSVVDLAVWPCAGLVGFEHAVPIGEPCQSLDNNTLKKSSAMALLK